MIKVAPKVLSIQSHVTYGYAGNKSAVFPMQRLGIEVSPIHTVQLSNHSGYPTVKGDFFSAEQIENIISGLELNDFLHRHNALLSGYIGNGEIAGVIAATIKKLKQRNSKAIYACDPVFGDYRNGKGHIFATAQHPQLFREQLIPLADIITPNLFELATLANTVIHNIATTKSACETLQSQYQNPDQIILVTSCSFDKSSTGLALYQQGNIHHITSPRYEVSSHVSGSGDATASIFLAHILNGKSPMIAMQQTLYSLDKIFLTTSKLQKDELALIEAQEYIC